MRQTRLVSDPHPTNYFLPSPFFSPGASPLESNFFPLPCTSSSIILQVQSRVLPGCLPAPRTAVTFMSNPQANSVVMFNHRGGKEMSVCLRLKTALQLIIISPSAFTKATEMRQKPNRPEIGISFWLRSVPTHHLSNSLLTVLNTGFFYFLCLKITKHVSLLVCESFCSKGHKST